MPRIDRHHHRRGAGFSLIEMLVALAVFALTVLALLNLSGENVRSAALIEQSTLAGVVADNRAIAAMLATPAELAEVSAGNETLGGHDWHWSHAIASTDMDGIARVDIRVSIAGDPRVAAEASVFRSAQ